MQGMSWRNEMILRCFVFLVFVLASFSNLAAASNCFKCHHKKEIFKGKVHEPVASGKCYRCHLPHVSRYKGLLKERADRLCFECHVRFGKELKKAAFVHTPVEKKACLRCHLPHSSTHKALLVKDEKELCLSCHGELKKKMVFVHKPFRDGKCTVCHDPHFSRNMVFVKNMDRICFKCHGNRVKLKASHRYGDLKRMNCVGCHNPHGSGKRFLIKDFSHKPFAEKKCNLCHKKGGVSSSVCVSCHKGVEKSFNHLHNHQLGRVRGNSCLACHNPHVGADKNLLADIPMRMCQSCHPETYKQKRESLYVHPEWSNCINCHAGHGSDHPAMLKGDGNAVCVRCHKTQGKFTHPVGKEVLDPRNGQPITCVTCHDTMGTNFKYNLRLSGEAALCIECHKNY